MRLLYFYQYYYEEVDLMKVTNVEELKERLQEIREAQKEFSTYSSRTS